MPTFLGMKCRSVEINKPGFVRYQANKSRARALVLELLEKHRVNYPFPYKKIVIRNQKTRWGSCSKAGNLNFNYRIIFLPSQLADYLVVHELCHLSQFNHSEKFWHLIEEVVPDFQKCRRELKLIDIRKI